MISKYLLIAFATTYGLLSSGALFSDEPLNNDSIQEHVLVRPYTEDPERRERIQALRIQEKEEEERNFEPPFQGAAFVPFSALKPTLCNYSYGFPVNGHWLIGVGDDNRSIEMEDGSHWEISPSDKRKLNSWKREDLLTISPVYSWFNSYDYEIVNKSAGSKVTAKLLVGPLAFGHYSHWIVDIDFTGGHVALENHMVWCVDPKDDMVLRSWGLNDHIILGINQSWFSHYDHILINVNMNEHVRAKRY